jgi:hypothetical protein
VPTVEVPIAVSGDDQSVSKANAAAWPTTGDTLTRSTTGVDQMAVKGHNGTEYRNRQALFSFDTGAVLPDDATVTDVQFDADPTFKSITAETAPYRNIVIRYYNWDGTSASDWTDADTDTAGTAGNDGFSLVNITQGTRVQIPLQVAGVSKTGLTKLRVSLDGGNRGTNSYSACYFAAIDDPDVGDLEAKLVITYTESGTTEELRPDAILLQTNDTKTLTDLQRDVP